MRYLIRILCFVVLTQTGWAASEGTVRWYYGPPRAAGEIALLKVPPESGVVLGRLWKIGREPLTKDDEFVPSKTREIELIPAMYSLEVFYASASASSNTVLTFTCAAGHVYELNAAPAQGGKAQTINGPPGWTAWIVDTTTKRIVAGFTPEAAVQPESPQTSRGNLESNLPQGPFSVYDQRIIKQVQSRWYALIKQQELDYLSTPGVVVVHFQLNADGTVQDLTFIQNTMGEIPGLSCEKAIQDCAPFEPLPDKLRATGGKRDIEFTFYGGWIR